MSGTGTRSADDAGVLATLRGAPPPVRALLAGMLVNRLGTFFQMYLVLFLTARGFTSIEAGAALGGYGAGTIAGLLLGGALADRLGPRLATLISMSGTGALLIAVVYVHNFPVLVGVVVLVGVSTQLFRPAASAMLAMLTPKHRKVMIFAVYRLVHNVGTTTAPLVGALLVAVSYDLLFLVEALACGIFAVVAGLAIPRRVAAAPAEPGPVEAASGENETEARPVRRGYAAVLTDRRYLLFLAALLVNIIVYIQYVAILPLAMRDAGLATGWYSLVLALNGFIVITSELLVTKLAQRMPARVVAVVGFLLLGAGQAVYGVDWGVVAFIVGTLVWTLAEIVGGPTMFAYPALAAPSHLLGRYQGASQATFGLGTVLGPIIGIALWHRLGPAVWALSAMACLLGIGLAWSGMRAAPADRAPLPPGADPAPAASQASGAATESVDDPALAKAGEA